MHGRYGPKEEKKMCKTNNITLYKIFKTLYLAMGNVDDCYSCLIQKLMHAYLQYTKAVYVVYLILLITGCWTQKSSQMMLVDGWSL